MTENDRSPLKDPVCGMTVTVDSPHRHEHEGRTWFFCSAHCAAKFAADPTRYLEPREVPEPAVSATGVYICPMHPEIRRNQPGDCPKCGMALEPEMPSVDDEEHPELVDFTRRFWWTLAGKENDTPWSLARGTQGVTRKALPPPPGRTSPGPGVGGESRAETGEGQAARSGGERCTSST